MGSGRIKRKYQKGSLKPKKIQVYPNGFNAPTEWVRPLNSKEIDANRTYYKECEFEGVKIKQGSKVIWN
jgi:hypothetical protein